MLTLPAHAKINLTLEVLGKRESGYHEVASVIQTIALKDTLSFQLDDEIHLICDHPRLSPEGNLVVKAAKLLRETTGSRKGALISLSKGIPLSAGLGGGSSDAAATLRALNELWGLGLSREELCPLASKLGSDVPFFLYGGTVLVEGIGEKLTPLPSPPPSWLVLLKPPIDIPNKTERLYDALRPSYFTSGKLTKKMVELLQRGDRIPLSQCQNVFEKVAFPLFPQLEGYRRRFTLAGAGTVHLAGAGPTLFAPVDSREQGGDVCDKLRQDKLEVYLSQTLRINGE